LRNRYLAPDSFIPKYGERISDAFPLSGNANQPISEIAYDSGFADHTNFARNFRRRFGHTPGSHWGDHA